MDESSTYQDLHVHIKDILAATTAKKNLDFHMQLYIYMHVYLYVCISQS